MDNSKVSVPDFSGILPSPFHTCFFLLHLQTQLEGTVWGYIWGHRMVGWSVDLWVCVRKLVERSFLQFLTGHNEMCYTGSS